MENMLQSFNNNPTTSHVNDSSISDQVNESGESGPHNAEFWKEIEFFIQNALDTIARCSDAVGLFCNVEELFYNEILAEKNLSYAGFSCLLNCEEALLSLASSGEVEGIFYANIIKPKNTSNITKPICRIFEYDCYCGFFSDNSDLIKVQTEVNDVLPIHVFNDMDVTNNAARNSILLKKKGEKERRKRYSYKRFLRENKTSVVNSSKGILA